MTSIEKQRLKILLLKYQLIYFAIVFCLSLILLFGYSKIQFILAENLFKTNLNGLLVQDFRTVVLNLDQFVPSQFSSIELIKDAQVIINIGTRNNSLLTFDTKFDTIDGSSLNFSSSYVLIFSILGLFLGLSLLISRYINTYFTHAYQKQVLDQVKLEKSELLNQISKKVAHDIRSPLSTLNMLASMIENSEIREMQNAVTEQIDRIANDLLSYSKSHSHSLQTESYSLKNLLSLMQKEYHLKSSNIECSIKFVDKLSLDINFIDSTTLYQNLNNFINNSIEAQAKNIIVSAELVKNIICIQVIDDGCGIDESNLKKIGNVEFTTKNFSTNSRLVRSGSGIAMVNALKSFQERGWALEIQSKAGSGTTVNIKIKNQEI